MSIFKLFCCGRSNKKDELQYNKNAKGSPSAKPQLRNVEIYSCSKMGSGRRKSHCQDSFCIMDNFSKNCHFFAVYDGHGHLGLDASLKANYAMECYIRKNSKRIKHFRTDKQFRTLLKAGFKKSENLFKEASFDYTSSGTCCISVLIQQNKCYIANLGDSRAVLCQTDSDNNLRALELSSDHKPNRTDEQERIERKGGRVGQMHYHGAPLGPMRVWGNEYGPGIAVSRTFGDLRAKEIGLTWEPEIDMIELKESDKFIVIASDGLWDVMEADEVVKFLADISGKDEDREKATEALITEARKRWQKMNLDLKGKEGMREVGDNCDDITVVVGYLQFDDKERKETEDKIVVDIG